MNVILSTGVGRLHLIDTARAVRPLVQNLEVICGYIPRENDSWWLNMVGRLIARSNLADRLKRRLGPNDDLRAHLRSNGWAEAIAQAFYFFGVKHLFPLGMGQRFGWWLFGFRTKRYFVSQDIFHVRSGAGQGGAIRAARAKGLRVLVDHSIAHPAAMAKALEEEYSIWGLKMNVGSRDPFWELVMRDCADADLILVNSDFVKQTFIAEGFAESKLVVGYLGVSEDFWNLKQSYAIGAKLRLLFVGSFEARKGARLALKMLALLEKRGIEAELYVAGESEPGRSCLRGEPGYERVVWVGAIMHEGIKDLLRSSDIFVFPTFAEGCARAAMEAMFAGLPVVTTPACGLPGLPGVHYYSVPVGSAEAMAHAVSDLYSSESRRACFGRAGVGLAQSKAYTWSAYGERVVEVYHELMGCPASCH